MNIIKSRLVYAALLSSLLVACGGGGGGDSQAGTPTITETAEGLYTGKTSTDRNFGVIVLNNGTYYGVYTSVANPVFAAGFVQGTGTSNNGSFTSNNLRDFNLEAGTVSEATLSASYRPKTSISGTIGQGNESITFNGTYDPIYEQTPTLAAIAGTYTTAEGGTVNVASSGTLNGSFEACTFNGTVSPGAKGNVYVTSVTFGSSCDALVASKNLAGIAVLDAAGKKVTAIVLTPDRDVGALLIGTKP